MSAKLNILEQGRELADEIEIPRTPLISRQTAAAAINHETAPPAAATSISDPPKPRGATARKADILDDLAEEKELLVPLNVRVAEWVFDELNQRILQMKLKGRRIKKEKVVEEAIITYLGLARKD